MTVASIHDLRRHPVAAGVARLHAELDGLGEVPVWSMDYDELGETLLALTRLRARVEELELRVAARAEARDLGETTGAATTAAWWAHHSRMTHPEARRRMATARALDGDHEPVGDALAAGELLTDQARVVIAAVDALPDDLDPGLVHEARAHLVRLGSDHDARELKVLGRRVLEVLTPDVAEAHEAKLLEAEETEARAASRFTMADDGHGRCHGRFTLPTAQGAMLRKQLLALTSAGERQPELSMPARLGEAFLEYVERYPADRLPDAGGLAATAVVTMTLDTLGGGLAPGRLDTGELLSPGQTRRLACEAGIIPVVLGGRSQVLDVGRKRRFHTRPQRVALGLRDGGCTAQGCDRPPGGSHAHHDDPWSTGGSTNIRRGRLLCPRHHTLAHHSDYATQHLPGGKVAFVRRT